MNGPTCKNKRDIKSSKDVDEMTGGIGQGELYSPDHAIKINTKKLKEENGQGELYSPDHAIKINTKKFEQNNNNRTLGLVQKQDNHNYQEEVKGDTMVGRGVANDIKNKMGMVKERLMEKLAAASVPSDALENTRQFFESVIKDVTSAAQGLTKEALYKIKSHLADILPSQSPLTSKGC
ncbi:uncharacterized protein LOC104883909 isoform X2 [Beta vulgaris subsp. vulgaris]|uniref:uncharacterized protein LOC104883909 isoform X2 n=1 Tax=Beta vulgaris subsp. vulgaris TaxID=3555 RepID=UPI0009014AC8|nr:uncharacterized protein LOC104883909 isoform X2 [Beta vulgaris subsp. vulgaris]